MGMSTQTITVEHAKAVIKNQRYIRTTWNTEKGSRHATGAELSDNGKVILYFSDRYPRLFAVYERLG